MTTRTRIRHHLLLPAVLAGVMLVACSKTDPASLPKGQDLLKQAGQVMRAVTSAHAQLKFEGELAKLVNSAEGNVSRDGQAQGTIVIGGADFPFRLVGGTFYLKPPLGGWVKSPPPYDPSKLLDPDKGLPSLLTNATDGQTKGEDSVGGKGAYTVEANIPTDVIREFTDLPAGQDKLKATLSIAKDSHHLLRFRVPFRSADNTDSVITGTLSDFGVKFTVQPPA